MPEIESVLVCPVSKKKLQKEGQDWVAPSGLRWTDGNFLVPLDFSKDWSSGQAHYEEWDSEWLANMESSQALRTATDAGVKPVYEQIPLEGDVLDVGGNIGIVADQASIEPDSYLGVDPIEYDLGSLRNSYPHVFAHYPKLSLLRHLRASAEFLPIRDLSFDTVHMRSVIDHLAAPHIALLEAYRVLRPEGRLVIGTSLEGAYALETGRTGLAGAVVSAIKHRPRLYAAASRMQAWLAGARSHEDHHVFHPTQEGLHVLLSAAGFGLETEVWQPGHSNVLYISALKGGS